MTSDAERGTSAARVTSLSEKPLLVKPGLAKPAPVSSRASAAAASVAVVSDGVSSFALSPTGGCFFAEPASSLVPGVAALPCALAVSAFCGLTDLNGLSGLTGPSVSGRRCGLVTLAGVKTLREAGGGLGGGLGAALPSEPLSVSCAACPLGAAESWRFSACLVNTDVLASAESDPADPFWLLPWAPFTVESDDAGAGDSWSVPFLRLGEFLPCSVFPLLDLRTVVSTLGSAPPASSVSAAGSAWLSTHPPVKSLATRLSAASDAWAGMARSRQS